MKRSTKRVKRLRIKWLLLSAHEGTKVPVTYFDQQDLKDLCKGKIQWRKCQDCDANGIQYWDGFTGEGVCNNPSHIHPDRIDYGGCDTCGGIGYIFYRVD